MLTTEHRRTLEGLAVQCPDAEEAIVAALADLDAATAALRSVADHLRTLRGKYAGAKRSDLTYIFSPCHADAVLAAAGEDRP